MDKKHVVITGKIMPSAEKMLRERCNVQQWTEPTAIPRDTLFTWLQNADGLFVNFQVRVDEELLAHAPKLKVIAQAAVGYDNIDIAACTRRGIPVGNTPGVLTETTADLAFALLLCAARRIHETWDIVRHGKWNAFTPIPFGTDLYGKTLGIVGLGSIGAAVARRAQACGMRIIYHNRHRRPDDDKLGVTYVSFPDLLRQSDAVLVQVPLSDSSRLMFGREEFTAMKPTAIFVNAARGAVVDTMALYEALKNKQIAYAALDVTDPEPLPGDHPLLTLPNILVTPHIGSLTYETRDRMARLAAENLLAGLEQRPLPACVNQEVNYPARE